MVIYIRGAGDLATGVALRLYRCGFQIVMTDLPEPTAIRRTVCFSEAIRKGRAVVEDVTAVYAKNAGEALVLMRQGYVAVLADPEMKSLPDVCPDVLVDVILAKKNLGTKITDASVVIGVGPGFTAGEDCHAVVETMRGHSLGRAIYKGSALPDTGIPGNIEGYTSERVMRAPCAGIFQTKHEIGDLVEAGETVAEVDGYPVKAAISGMIRGLLPDGTPVPAGMKSGDVDPRGDRADFLHTSDKALSIAGGVLEAILCLTAKHPSFIDAGKP